MPYILVLLGFALLWALWYFLDALAERKRKGFLVTTVDSDEAKIIAVNGNAVRMIHAVKGMRSNASNPFLLEDGEQPRKPFNWHWMNPFTESVKPTLIQHTRLDPTGKFLIVDPNKTLEWSVRRTINLVFEFEDIEMSTGILKKVTFQGIFKVYDFYKFTQELHGDAFGVLLNDTKTEIGLAVVSMTPQDYMKSRRDTDGILSKLKNPDGSFNQIIFEKTGIKLFSGRLVDQQWTQEIQDSLDAEAEATGQARGVIAAAHGQAEAIREIGQAHANASAAEIDQMTESWIKRGLSPNDAANKVADILVARAQPGMTTKVTGNGNTPVMITPDKK